jgi:ferric-dicitrate binding protein FerR (iron transport regulator)
VSSIRLVALLVVCAAVNNQRISADVQSTAARLAYVEGVVYLDDRPVAAPLDAEVFRDSATIRTADGRAVVALKRGGTLALNEHTKVRVLANGVYNFNRIEVIEGTAVLISSTSAPAVSCRNDVKLSSAGAFRFDVQASPPDGRATCRFRVYDGAAAVTLASLVLALRSGEAIVLDPTCGDMIPSTMFAMNEFDAFDRWSREQATIADR